MHLMVIFQRTLPVFLKVKSRFIFGSLDIGNRIRQKHIFSIIRNLRPNGKNILDGGCGSGVFALRVAHRYPDSQLQGLDYDMYHVEQAESDQRVLRIKNVEFRQGDLAQPLGENKYDLIFCVDVLEHISSDETVLGNFFLALKPDGNLLIHVPLLNQRRFFNCFNDWAQDDHVRDGYDEQSLVNMLERQGFVVIDKRYTFGWAGALAWEIHEICRCFGKLARLGAFPVLALLAALDLRLRNQKGNAILMRAMKESHHAD